MIVSSTPKLVTTGSTRKMMARAMSSVGRLMGAYSQQQQQQQLASYLSYCHPVNYEPAATATIQSASNSIMDLLTAPVETAACCDSMACAASGHTNCGHEGKTCSCHVMPTLSGPSSDSTMQSPMDFLTSTNKQAVSRTAACCDSMACAASGHTNCGHEGKTCSCHVMPTLSAPSSDSIMQSPMGFLTSTNKQALTRTAACCDSMACATWGHTNCGHEGKTCSCHVFSAVSTEQDTKSLVMRA